MERRVGEMGLEELRSMEDRLLFLRKSRGNRYLDGYSFRRIRNKSFSYECKLSIQCIKIVLPRKCFILYITSFSGERIFDARISRYS